MLSTNSVPCHHFQQVLPVAGNNVSSFRTSSSDSTSVNDELTARNNTSAASAFALASDASPPPASSVSTTAVTSPAPASASLKLQRKQTTADLYSATGGDNNASTPTIKNNYNHNNVSSSLMVANSNSSSSSINKLSAPAVVAAPRPLPAQQVGPPAWMLAALSFDALMYGMGAASSSYSQNIINDVFFTPEQNLNSPSLTPVSDIDDSRISSLHLPVDSNTTPSSSSSSSLFTVGMNSEEEDYLVSLTSDLDLFGNPPAIEDNVQKSSSWRSAQSLDSISVCSSMTRQPSPTPTMIAEPDSADSCIVHRHASSLLMFGSAKQQQSSDKTQYCTCNGNATATATAGSAVDASETASLSGESCVDENESRPMAVRESLRPTIFEELCSNGVDWCRYCGTTEGINWRPGPWGKRTLCNKHGCDYKGYGFASKMPRLNLKSFMDETLQERLRPVLQTFCQICQQAFSDSDNVLVHCDGCHRAYHQSCHPEGITQYELNMAANSRWYCEPSCRDNIRRQRIIVELPKCRLPYMCSPRHTNTAPNGLSLPAPPAPLPPLSSALRSAPASRGSNDRSSNKPAVTRKRKYTRRNTTTAAGAATSNNNNNKSLINTVSHPASGPASKVRKSARVGRPSVRRRESDFDL